MMGGDLTRIEVTFWSGSVMMLLAMFIGWLVGRRL